MWMDGQAERTAVYALRDISGADVVDVYQEFSVVKRAVVMGTTVAAAVAMSVSGTEITIPAGANRDAGYMMVFGAAAGA
jgi:hypothetical protein